MIQKNFIQLIEWNNDDTIFHIVLTTTIILVLLYSSNNQPLEISILVIVILGLLNQQLIRNAKYWFVLSIILIVGNFSLWYVIDNHIYLICIWCIGIFLSLQTFNPQENLKISARFLIGLTFLFAVIQKFTSIDFINNSFFHFTLLSDPRFSELTNLLGNLPMVEMQQNEIALEALTHSSSMLMSVQLISTRNVHLLAIAITWWTLFIESLVTLAFLSPTKTIINKWRNYFLLTFVLTTYFFAEVVGFAWILIIMGLAQLRESERYLSIYFIIALFLIQLFRLV